MKELSIEEKAKAYDEAIERAKYYYDEGKTLEYADDIASGIFPELKESEDEKIRKRIIEWIEEIRKCNPNNAEHNGDCSEAIAWLEKQGEQKPYGQRQECVDCQFNYAGECKGYCAMKRGEQKPVEWSEEDEGWLDNAIVSCEQCGNTDTADWLKSLKDRVQPQNKWKESLGTADLENSLCDIQDGFSDTSYEYRILGEAIEFIRCTEPKPHWKPSDEQIYALRSVVSKLKHSDNNYAETIEDLYNDLEKLRE